MQNKNTSIYKRQVRTKAKTKKNEKQKKEIKKKGRNAIL